MIQSIEKLMLQEHKRLNKLIMDLEKNLDNYEKTKTNFSVFKWNLEKHFFVEEKIIFDMFINISGEETNDIFHLLEDHVGIMGELRML
jgi:hemerythrin superfamily protein